MSTKKVIVRVNFEDEGQDLSYLQISFYPDFKFGEIIDAGPFHRKLYTGQFVLSGQPGIGGHVSVSKSPADEVIELKYKIESVEYEK